MLIILACGSLAVAALLYVFWFNPEPTIARSRAERDLEFIAERKEVIYEGLRDLTMEYRMGKLSDADYTQLKTHYQEQLAALLHETDQLGSSTDALPDPVPGRCQRCGKDNPKENNFCGACGFPLSPGEQTNG